jgi:hypothetical protein
LQLVLELRVESCNLNASNLFFRQWNSTAAMVFGYAGVWEFSAHLNRNLA